LTELRLLLFDVGGVILTDGWDTGSRAGAVKEFGLEAEEFQDRHSRVASALETGQISLDDYLTYAVFHRPRPFSRDAFLTFMLAQSEALEDSLKVLDELAAMGRFTLATLNNESRELNEFRIRKFSLDRYFSTFFSSCYLGLAKPDPKIYRLALDVTQRAPDECLFIDNRSINVEAAARAGIPTVLFESARQLRAALGERGVALQGS
jgi:putative hydrolase of the HAD superfamily